MQKYLRAVGFSEIRTKKQEQEFVKQSIIKAKERNTVKKLQGTVYAEYRCEIAKHIGINVCGEIDNENIFIYSHYIPYARGRYISSRENITFEIHKDNISFSGICDETKLGISLIFYLQNALDYIKVWNKIMDMEVGVVLSALALEGKIIMQVEKTAEDRSIAIDINNIKSNLIKQARKGDERAVELLTKEENNIYNTIPQKIQELDVYTIVDSHIIPYGTECDEYMILGEITSFFHTKNKFTQEWLTVMTLVCNDVTIELCINDKDLVGEVEVGRRFKGIVWLQGELLMV